MFIKFLLILSSLWNYSSTKVKALQFDFGGEFQKLAVIFELKALCIAWLAHTPMNKAVWLSIKLRI